MNPIRILLVGAGLRGTWAIAELLAHPDDFTLVAVVESIPTRHAVIRRHFNRPHLPCYSTLAGALAHEACEAVAIFTPDATHPDLVPPALQAHKYVFVEKPLAIDEAGLQRILQADARAGSKTFVGMNLRYAPAFARVKALIDQGVAGRVLTLQQDEFYDGGRTYFRRWNRLRSVGGGLWITKACHDFDLLHWLAGAAPTSVAASSALSWFKPRTDAALHCRDCPIRDNCYDRYDRYIQPDSLPDQLNRATEEHCGQRADLCLYNSDKDTFDHGAAVVRFANEVVATYTVNVVAGFTNRRLRVGGTRAAIDADLESGQILVHHRDPASTETLELDRAVDMHAGADQHVWTQFARFVRGQPATYTAPPEAAVAVRIGLAAQQSCDTGKTVQLT